MSDAMTDIRNNKKLRDQIAELRRQLAEAERDRQLCYACNTRLDEANDALYQRQGKPTYEQLEQQLAEAQVFDGIICDPVPVCEWKKADGSNYIRQEWHPAYIANEGDKLYLVRATKKDL